MEMAAKVITELAFSGLFRVVSILNKNFRDVITTEEMKPLNDFVDCEIEVLTREAKSDDLVQLMSSLKELQAAALKMKGKLDLYEYEQIEKQVNSSSSEAEPIPEEKVLPKDLRDGLNKLLKIVERVENIRQSITTGNTFVDYLVGEFHVARPVIKLALSDISRLIKMLGSKLERGTNYREILEQLKDVVSYHIQALIRNVNFDYLAQSVQLLDMLQAASLQLDLFDIRDYIHAEIQVSSSYSVLSKKKDLGSFLLKPPLRIGLEKLLKFVEQVEKKHPSITSRTDTTQPQGDTIIPTLRVGVEKWLKFVKQVEKEHPFIRTKKATRHLQDYTSTPISTTFFPGRGFLSARSLENGKCREDAEEIMRNHKNNLKDLNFEWTNIAGSTDTCKEVLERLEPDQNLESLRIIGYSCAKFPSWMVKENWLPHLHTLRLQSCRSLKTVPFLPPGLQALGVCDCNELMQLSGLSDTLLNLHVEICPKLTSLGNLQHCTSLRELSIFNCRMLRREEASLVEGVVEGDIANRLPHVERIYTDAPSLVLDLVQQQAFSSIMSLTLRDCACAVLPNLEKLSSLVSLYIVGSPDVELLPNLPVSLQYVYIKECPKLKEKYEEGGPLRNTISHMPHIFI